MYLMAQSGWEISLVSLGKKIISNYILALHFSVISSHLLTVQPRKSNYCGWPRTATTQNPICGRLLCPKQLLRCSLVNSWGIEKICFNKWTFTAEDDCGTSTASCMMTSTLLDIIKNPKYKNKSHFYSAHLSEQSGIIVQFLYQTIV
jgi:hypothetical protein